MKREDFWSSWNNLVEYFVTYNEEEEFKAFRYSDNQFDLVHQVLL